MIDRKTRQIVELKKLIAEAKKLGPLDQSATGQQISSIELTDQETPTEHFVENRDTLLRWQTGNLSEEKEKELIEHLTKCTQCRQTLGNMMDEGTFFFYR